MVKEWRVWNQDEEELKAIKQFDADAKFGEVKKYQEDIEVLLKGISDEVNALAVDPQQSLLNLAVLAAFRARVSPSVDMLCWSARALIESVNSRTLSSPMINSLSVCIEQQKQLKDFTKAEKDPHH